MKKFLSFLIITTLSLSLAGCDDLPDFEKITQEIGKEIDLKGVEKVLVSHLAEVFGMQIF